MHLRFRFILALASDHNGCCCVSVESSVHFAGFASICSVRMSTKSTAALLLVYPSSDPDSVPSVSTVSFSADQFQQLMDAVEVLSSVHASLEDKLEKLKRDLIKKQEIGAEKWSRKDG